MKKNVIRITIVSIVVALLAILIPLLTILANKKTYKIDVSQFNNIIMIDGNPVLSSLSIVETRGGSNKTISITEDMVVSCDDTTTVGKKQLVLKYNNQLFTVDFEVKCKVDFVCDGEVINTQYVLDLEEIEFPSAPQKQGCEFVKWHSDNVGFGTNLVYTAMYTVSESVMPKLSLSYAVTYGDTLASVTLPSNSNGSWKFVDELSTPVGNAGENTFKVVFVPSNSSLLKPEEATVTLAVAKQKVDINVIQDEFSFDGTKKVPIYSTNIADLKIDCVINNAPAINAGSYSYKLEINEQNYKGTYYGTLKINKVYAKIQISDFNMDYTEAVPSEYEYSVLNKNDEPLDQALVDLLGVQIEIPTITDADKTYEITAKINDNLNFDVEVINGELTFNKVEWELGENLKILKDDNNQITYGSPLSEVEFAEFVHGKWQWDTPEKEITNVGKYIATATFVPNNDNYLPVTRDIELEIIKKEITIQSVITENTYIYDGKPHTISYTLEGVESLDVPETIAVSGVITHTTANERGYITTLTIVDDRYIGSKETSLIINKASCSDFDSAVVDTNIVWNSNLKLRNIQLNTGYTWEYPDTVITNCGKQSYLVNYTPIDTTNYKIESQLVEINVDKALANIEIDNVLNNYILYIYNPNGYDFEDRLSANHTENSLVVECVLDNSKVDKLDNVGVYTVNIYLAESVHYLQTSKTITVEITKVENSQVVSETQTATYGDLLNTYLPENDNFGSWSWQTTETTVGNATTNVANNTAATRTFVAVYTPNNLVNYESREVIVEFTVNQKEVIVPTIANKVFNNKEQKPTEQELDYNQTLYNIVQNNGGTNVGTYNVVLSLKDPSNYVWADKYAGLTQITLTYNIISSSENDWLITPTISKSWTYGEKATVNAVSRFGDYAIKFKKAGADDSTYITFDVTKSNTYAVGNYTAIFVVDDGYSPYNSSVLNYNGLTSSEFNFTINYLEITEPKVENLEHTYDGSPKSATIETNSYYTIKNNSRVNVGEQTITISLNNANCKWSDGTVEDITYTLKVSPATNAFRTSPVDKVVTYGESYDQTVEVDYGNSNLVITYSADGGKSYTSSVPKNVGSYKIKYTIPALVVDGHENYAEIFKVVDLTINKASVTITGTNLTDKPYYENSAVTSVKNSIRVTGSDGTDLTNAGTFKFDGDNTEPTLVLKTTNPTTSQTYETLSYTVSFTPSDTTNYNSSSVVNGSIKLNRVAYIGSTYYGSIENALAEVVNATSATTVTVIPNASGDVTIASDVTIGVKVTLALPYLSYDDNTTHVVNISGEATLYNGTKDVTTDDVTYKYVNGDFTKQKLTNKVVVLRGITITNNGTIKIAGELSAGSTTTGVCGNTARNFAELELQDGIKVSNNKYIEGAKIVSGNGSRIYCYGYIDTSNTTTSNKVEIEVENEEKPITIDLSGNVSLESGSNLELPFIVNDMCGGSFMTACYKPLSSQLITPFKQFELRNIISSLTINSGATVIGYANMWANSKIYYTPINLIGNDSTCLINLSTGAKLECKYNSLDRNDYIGSDNYANNVWLYGVNNLTFKGGATSNSLSMTIVGEPVTTENVPFPISWHQNITLANLDGQTGATYTMNNGYKLLPGSEFVVDSGVTLTINNINVYDKNDFSDDTSNGFPVVPARYGYYQDGTTSMNLPAAKLEVNGTIIATGGISGKVTSKISGANIKASKVSYTTYEVKKYWKLIVLSRYTINTPLTLVNADGTTKTGSANTTYIYNGSTWS